MGLSLYRWPNCIGRVIEKKENLCSKSTSSFVLFKILDVYPYIPQIYFVLLFVVR